MHACASTWRADPPILSRNMRRTCGHGSQRCRFAALLFALPLTTASRRQLSTVSPLLPDGNPECPCISPHPINGGGADYNHPSCPAGTILTANGTCYSGDYGSRGCRAYEVQNEQACQLYVGSRTNSLPSWCNDRWCYVAPWNCKKPYSLSNTFLGAVIGNEALLNQTTVPGRSGQGSALDCFSGPPSHALAYSYETCGTIDSYTYEQGFYDHVADLSARGPLRITIPGDEPPYITTVGENETDYLQGTPRRDGSIPRFVTQTLTDLGLSWVYVPISPESRMYSPGSSFTACTHDVALNNTDICVGSVWPYEYRRRIASFSSSITSTTLRVVTPVVQNTIFRQIFRPFLPFDGLLWLGLLLATMYAGYALYTLNATGYHDEEYVEGASGLTARAQMQLKWANNWRHIFCPTTYDDARDLSLSMAESLQSFLGGGDFRHQPHDASSWLVFLGFSFLILVTISNYTAQVTAINVLNTNTGQLASFEQGVALQWTFCGWESLKGPILKVYPELKPLYVGLPNGHDAFQAMDNGLCDAAIIDVDAWLVAQGGAYSLPEDNPRYAAHPGGAARYHCDTKMMLEATVHSVDIALPVRDDLQKVISWAMTVDIA